MEIRKSKAGDVEDIVNIHLSAFGAEEGPEIVKLVLAMLEDATAEPLVSLVASEGEGLLGHILFSNVSLDGKASDLSASILAPLAVLPDGQRSGVGKSLIQRGLAMLKEQKCDLVFVYGDPDYYTKWGFEVTDPAKFVAPAPLSYPHGWHVQCLGNKSWEAVSGTLKVADSLSAPAYW